MSFAIEGTKAALIAALPFGIDYVTKLALNRFPTDYMPASSMRGGAVVLSAIGISFNSSFSNNLYLVPSYCYGFYLQYTGYKECTLETKKIQAEITSNSKLITELEDALLALYRERMVEMKKTIDFLNTFLKINKKYENVAEIEAQWVILDKTLKTVRRVDLNAVMRDIDNLNNRLAALREKQLAEPLPKIAQ